MNENNHPINDLMQTTMAKIREMVDANTVVGQPITTQDGVTLIPVSRLSFGFASGGSDFGGKAQQADKNFGGGAGAGVSVVPVAFLVVKEGQVKLIPMGPPAADTASLMSSCGGNLDQTLPEMCLAVSPSRRKAVQAKMAAESAAFFLKYLGTPNPPPLPPEPEDHPQIASHPATPEKNTARKKRR